MKAYLKKLPQEFRDLIRLAGNIAVKNNTPIYLVGGFVRDLILGVKNLDLDIVAEGAGIGFAEEFAAALNAKVIRHKRFGTATVILKPGLKIDIATARKEFYPQEASLPLVSFGRLKEDLTRRDFTINTMAIGIAGENSGKLIDYFGAKADLHSKKIRVLHKLSFIDDPTRILRAVRFEQRYGFKIEPRTLKYLKHAVRINMLKKVQPQRVRDELILIFKERSVIKPVKRLQALTGFGFIRPGLRIYGQMYQLLRRTAKQIEWFKRAYAGRRQLDSWLIYFMCLIDSLSKVQAKAVCKKFVFSRGEQIRILNYKQIDRRFIRQLSSCATKPSIIFKLLEPLSYEVIILLKAKFRNKNIQKHIEDFMEIYNGMRLYIGGDDLRRLGVMPGPVYQKIFTKVLNAKLNGEIKTLDEELALIKKLARQCKL